MSKNNEIKFIVHQGWGDFQTVWLVKYENGKPYNGYIEKGEVVFEEVKEGAMDSDMTPFLRLPLLKATKFHLEDMRKLVFNSLQQKKEGKK